MAADPTIVVSMVVVMIKNYMWVLLKDFKNDIYNHKSCFAHEIYRNKTSSSKYVWEIKKKKGTDPILKWEIVI